MNIFPYIILSHVAIVLFSTIVMTGSSNQTKCKDLLMGQYLCDEPVIDAETQQAQHCNQTSRTVNVTCWTAPNISCVGGDKLNGTTISFYKNVPCKWVNGTSFETALLLSVFLGMFGIDRFYLGYPAIGLVKFGTLGFMFLGQLVDILLIATQTLGPADGSDYLIDYFGAVLSRVVMDNKTYIKPQEYDVY